MIGYLEGHVKKIHPDGILLLVGPIGYEVLLPGVVLEKIRQNSCDEKISLHIYHHQTERQPKPVLIGFHGESEKDFFQLFITVDAIGPLKAVKAMERPVGEIAMAIETKDIAYLSTLKGIGKRTAEKIVAALRGKASSFAAMAGHENGDAGDVAENFSQSGLRSTTMKQISDQVVTVLVEQLGYTTAIARKMVAGALERNITISTPEQLFDEVLKDASAKRL